MKHRQFYEVMRVKTVWDRVPPRSKIREMLDGAISIHFPNEPGWKFFPKGTWRITKEEQSYES